MLFFSPCAVKRKKIREVNFGKYRRSKIELQGALLRQYKDNKNNSK
jgi:hypothetical protein